jgi:hypothetical protein
MHRVPVHVTQTAAAKRCRFQAERLGIRELASDRDDVAAAGGRLRLPDAC